MVKGKFVQQSRISKYYEHGCVWDSFEEIDNEILKNFCIENCPKYEDLENLFDEIENIEVKHKKKVEYF